MGTLLRVLRERRRLTQSAALAQLERRARQLDERDFALSLRQYARIEAGAVKTVPYPARRRVIEAEYGHPYDDLVAIVDDSTQMPAPRTTRLPETDPAALYGVIIDHLAQLDHEVGPGPAIEPATSVYQSVYSAAMSAAGRDKQQYLRLAAQSAELVGWFHQDSGRPDLAELWTQRALDLAEAVEAGDLVPYVLMRRSSIAIDLDQADEALLLAERALRRGSSSLDQALALREVAAAHALKGRAPDFCKTVERALEYADGTLPRSPLSVYCSVPYLLSEAGAAALRLGDPRLAITYLVPAVRDWPAAQARDRSICTARLAVAYARSGDVDQAEDIALRAVDTVVPVPSPSPRFSATLHVALQTITHVDQHRASRLQERLRPSLL